MLTGAAESRLAPHDVTQIKKGVEDALLNV
jgi:hypothetical protein